MAFICPVDSNHFQMITWDWLNVSRSNPYQGLIIMTTIGWKKKVGIGWLNRPEEMCKHLLSRCKSTWPGGCKEKQHLLWVISSHADAFHKFSQTLTVLPHGKSRPICNHLQFVWTRKSSPEHLHLLSHFKAFSSSSQLHIVLTAMVLPP